VHLSWSASERTIWRDLDFCLFPVLIWNDLLCVSTVVLLPVFVLFSLQCDCLPRPNVFPLCPIIPASLMYFMLRVQHHLFMNSILVGGAERSLCLCQLVCFALVQFWYVLPRLSLCACLVPPVFSCAFVVVIPRVAFLDVPEFRLLFTDFVWITPPQFGFLFYQFS